MTIFAVSWSELTLDKVRAFLDEADDESLLWEAKGTTLDKSEIRRQVCALANSHEGGYLILGADRVQRPPHGTDATAAVWALEGVQFPDEPRTWLANLISSAERGVRPMPDFDVMAWVAVNGHVAVIRILPTSTPPCMTNGTVYERVPGKTMTVRDPLRLAALFTRGDSARREAQARADHAALALHGPETLAAAGWVHFTVGVCATGNSPDIAHRLFRDGFADSLWQKLNDRPVGLPGPFRRSPEAVEWSQDALTCRHETRGFIASVTVARASWDGAAAVHQELALEEMDTDMGSFVARLVEPAWRLANELVSELGGFGDVYVITLFSGGPFNQAARTQNEQYVAARRGPLLPGINPLHVASLGRELTRALGQPATEP
jgi:hypothetical protein